MNKPGERPRSPKTYDMPEGDIARASGLSASPPPAVSRARPLAGGDSDSDAGDDDGADGDGRGNAVSSSSSSSGDDDDPAVNDVLAAHANSKNMSGWEQPGAHHRNPLPNRENCVELVRARQGCKWTISSLLECMATQGVDTDALWERVKDVILKTILSIRPALAAKYRAVS